MKLLSSGAPQPAVDETVRMCRMISDAVQYGRRFRSVFQPLSDDHRITWCQATVGITDDEYVDVWVVDDAEPPHHWRQSTSTAAVDVAYFGTELAQSSYHPG